MFCLDDRSGSVILGSGSVSLQGHSLMVLKAQNERSGSVKFVSLQGHRTKEIPIHTFVNKRRE